jgi:hypothetical protein
MRPVSAEESTALQLAKTLADRLDESGWNGVDPYDGLASPLARLLPGGHWRLRQAFIQGVRRSPVNLRTLLGIRPRTMAAATGLGASASARLATDPLWRARRDLLARRTAECQIDAGSFRGLWGYEFDVQTRWGFYAAGSPNIVATSFAAHGCLDGKSAEDERLAWLARGLLRHLWRGRYFAYTPGSDVLIHNANLLGAALAARLSQAPSLEAELCEALEKAAALAVRTAVEHQREDGSWPYGEGVRLGWVDGFHTAYSLLGLDQVLSRGIGGEGRFALERGAGFYFRSLFDGAKPVFYAGRTDGPSDINNVATGLRAAVWGARRGIVSPTFPADVLDHVRTRYWHERGYFKAASRRLRPASRLNYPRWAGAPALDALTAFAADRVA